MQFTVDRDTLLHPLQAVQGVVERRQTTPILANVLLKCSDESLSVSATDMELHFVATTPLSVAEPGSTTVPARKLIDICRSLSPGTDVHLSMEKDRVLLRCGRSRFVLNTLPAEDFPLFDLPTPEASLSLAQGDLKRLIDLTHFAMAQQDVRYYLNGLLLEFAERRLRAVATDGHRLAIADLEVDCSGLPEPRSLIVPRKGVMELSRALGGGDESIEIMLAANQIQVNLPGLTFVSKLIEGKFPDYDRVVPLVETCDKHVTVDREALRQSLARASILSNEKYRSIRLNLKENMLRVLANNPDQEEAEDEVEVEYSGDSLEIGFNVAYLIDALGVLPTESARLHLTDADSSCLITPDRGEACQYVVMPMRL
jgi:DNA polymerase-3 subunit beta